ncbi:MAG: tRNA uridine-5-carboxymethylaminomethyl(34) synthesis GTPase MnmE [Clostridia bacterium]|nr:tRNA uridine-5-carboxymethylaminomethyl(34) synthesis GTPase MnmE [Clostridia bacterium]
MIFDSTVAALSTPYGRGAIAMIRMTGADSLKIASAVFCPRNGRRVEELSPAHAYYGDFIYDGGAIDDGMLTVYRAPVSYTGEDMAELCCHGGVLVSSLILRALYDAGAAPAEGGEFTKRAFVNGKLRLTAAEAIMDVIDAESVGALRLAGANNRGLLSDEAGQMYDELKHLIAQTYAYIDYPDEDMTDVSPDELRRRTEALLGRAEALRAGYAKASAVCEGVDTVICGAPNVGKSSLMNLLTGRQTAIVTEIPGTTRDVVTGKAVLGDVTLRLSDTAGIRETTDTVERIGVGLARDAIKNAGLVLAVFDGGAEPDEAEREFIDGLKKLGAPVIAVINKSDSGDGKCYDGIFDRTVHISAKTGEGAELLEKEVNDLFLQGGIDYAAPHLINERQYCQMTRFASSLRSAVAALDAGQTQDVACLDLEDALSALAGLDGREVNDDIIGEIFGKFCVGK